MKRATPTLRQTPRPDIYAYDDFRIYLRDCYRFLSETVPGFSARAFMRMAGFANPGYANDVIKGRRPLSNNAAEKIVSALKLSPIEAAFFRLLVGFGQSKEIRVRDKLFREILFRRNCSSYARENHQIVKYYQDYRYALIRVAIDVCDFRGDFGKLGAFLDPPVTGRVVKPLVEDLCAWGMVVRAKNGSYSVTSKNIIPPPTLNQMVRKLNAEWISHAAQSLQKFGPDDRHVATLLLAAGPKTREKMRERIEAFRQEMIELSNSDNECDSVMQLSTQFFPKTIIREKP
jgi:uncharacterized protein (TIGR02147 family)